MGLQDVKPALLEVLMQSCGIFVFISNLKKGFSVCFLVFWKKARTLCGQVFWEHQRKEGNIHDMQQRLSPILMQRKHPSAFCDYSDLGHGKLKHIQRNVQ